MADARALLRNERQTRRVNHPYASYTSFGKLVCSLCDIPVKTDSLWNKHLESTDHVVRLQRLQSVPSDQSSKKRKADSGADEGRKRARGFDEEEDGSREDAEDLGPSADQEVDATGDSQTTNVEQQPIAAVGSTKDETQQPVEVEDEEWLELQQAINAAPAPADSSTVSAAATISAPAMSAAEVAAQAREEQSTQRGRRDEEIEAEREDAARALEEEFEEMEGLEDRVRKLREKREALRKGRAATDPTNAAMLDTVPGTDSEGHVASDIRTATASSNGVSISNGTDEQEADSDDDDYDEWNFGAS